MARPATAQRPAGRRPGRLDRSAQRHDSVDRAASLAPPPGSPSDDIPMSASAENSAEPPPSDLTPDTCWDRLPVVQREQFELRLSQLVLKAARIPSFDTEENT